MERLPKLLKEAAIEFLQLSASGNAREAFDLYVGKGFRHHNVNFKGDAESLMKAMEENAIQFPDKVFEVQHAIQEGDMVAVHSHVRFHNGEPGVALVHIFRFDENHISELWDLGQPVPEIMVNENGMF